MDWRGTAGLGAGGLRLTTQYRRDLQISLPFFLGDLELGKPIFQRSNPPLELHELLPVRGLLFIGHGGRPLESQSVRFDRGIDRETPDRR
jgi:hypothetical protein